jgi:hypothetical protein
MVEKLANFSAQTYKREAIVKTNYSISSITKQDNETPQPFDIGTLDCLEVE